MDIWKSDYYCYRLNPAPPKLPLQEYIDRYLETGDSAFFEQFLHYYEPAINAKAKEFVARFAMQGHFADLKAAYITSLLLALDGYKKERGPFTSYAEYEGKRAMHGYIRTMRTGFSVSSDTEYYLLRKAMRLFAERGQKADDETIAAIADTIHREPKTALEMIRSGMQNMRVMELDRESGDEDEPVEIGSLSDEPSALFFQDYQMDALYYAFRGLDYREREMLARHYGFCQECFSTRDKDEKPLEKQTYEDIMLQFGLSSPDTVKKTCKRALEKMRQRMQE